MSKPRSFRDMQRKAKKPPRIIVHDNPQPAQSEQEIQAENVAKKVMMALVSPARCPIDNGQLDGGVFAKRCQLECCFNPEHYQATFSIGFTKPTYQRIQLSSEVDGYQIECRLRDDEQYDCQVALLDLSLPEPLRSRRARHVASFVADVSPNWCRSYEVFKGKVELLQMLS